MVFACDMPNLSPILINSEINEFHKFAGKFQALVPKHFEGIEPLHAIYSKSVLKNIEENLLAGIYSVRSFYEKINIKYWEVEDKFVCNFINVNCPEDLEIIKKKLKLDLI